MYLNKITAKFAYLVWLLKNYHDQQNQSDIYRLVEVKKSEGECRVVIQVIGKSALVECKPHEIVENDRILGGFSKNDIRTMTYFACAPDKKPAYRILMQELCHASSQIVFKLKKHDSDEVLKKTAGQIMQDQDLINQLSHKDACSVSYAAGYEHSSVNM